jgi:glycerol uptake facilitator-like aquaporin
LKPRKELADLIGTFLLVFIGAGAGALVVGDFSSGGLVRVALALAIAQR